MTEEIKPLVSISCVTYNHAPFLRQCLDGFFMQKCDFDFEILLHDDASTDGTQEVIKEYMELHPGIIKPIFQTENQFSKGIRSMTAKFNFPRAKGKYIALCEGDDYWTDPLKLQKQVDFLEKHPDCSMVFSNAEVICNNDPQKNNNSRGLRVLTGSRFYEPLEIFEQWIVPTATVLFRRGLLGLEYEQFLNNPKFMFGDTILFLYLSTKGKLYGMTDYLASYRRHAGGATNIAIDIKYYKKDYEHTKEVIYIFGKNLKSRKIKAKLADYALSLGLYSMVSGRKMDGVNYLFHSLRYNPKFLFKYLQKRFSL